MGPRACGGDLELPAYLQKSENWGGAETLTSSAAPLLPRTHAGAGRAQGTAPDRLGNSRRPPAAGLKPCWGPALLGSACRDDIKENQGLLGEHGALTLNLVAPLGAAPPDLLRLPEAHCQRVCLYRRVGRTVMPAGWSGTSVYPGAAARDASIGVGGHPPLSA